MQQAQFKVIDLISPVSSVPRSPLSALTDPASGDNDAYLSSGNVIGHSNGTALGHGHASGHSNGFPGRTPHSHGLDGGGPSDDDGSLNDLVRRATEQALHQLQRRHEVPAHRGPRQHTLTGGRGRLV
jgi:hypothetical protein